MSMSCTIGRALARVPRRVAAAGRLFRRDESGNFLIMTSLALPVLVMTMGMAIDVGEAFRARTNFQAAVDAGALAAAKVVVRGPTVDDNNQREDDAAFLQRARQTAIDVARSNMAGYDWSKMSFDFELRDGDCSNGPITVTASLQHNIFFEGIGQAILGEKNYRPTYIDADGQVQTRNVREMHLQASTEVDCGNKKLEIALVLDNSGSMGRDGKMTSLKNAANTFINTVHTAYANAPSTDPLRISLVPFASMVNIGATNADASWMDTTGVSSIHHENLNWTINPAATAVSLAGGGTRFTTPTGAPLTRFSLYDAMGESWGGCVEARPWPHHTQDTAPDIADPDTLYVPSLAPDEPDNWTGQRERVPVTTNVTYCISWYQRRFRWGWWVWYEWRCYQWSDGSIQDYHPTNYTYPNPNGGEYVGGVYQGSTTGTTVMGDGDTIDEDTYLNSYIDDDHNYPVTAGLDVRDPSYTGRVEDQYKRLEWTWKYFNSPSVSSSTVAGVPGGPNFLCTTQAVTPLTGSKSTIQNAVNRMQPIGGTNVGLGTVWGWRTLSPGAPFTEGRSYTDSTTKKIMIVMTDGENFYGALSGGSGRSVRTKSYYGAFGYSQNGRIFAGYTGSANPSHTNASFTAAMNEHLLSTCTNAKAQGIDVYTISFDVPNGSTIKTMMDQCASPDSAGGKNSFDADNAQKLNEAFSTIADRISELSIVK